MLPDAANVIVMANDTWLPAPYEPQHTADVDRAFPARYQRLMPRREEIPAEFWTRANPWSGLTMHWMTKGWSSKARFAPRDGVDPERAFWHLHCIVGSYGPSHEFKEAAVNFLASRWLVGIADRGELMFGVDWREEPDKSG